VLISPILLHTFYIHHTIHTESGSGFSQKFKSGSEKYSRTPDPLWLCAHLCWPVVELVENILLDGSIYLNLLFLCAGRAQLQKDPINPTKHIYVVVAAQTLFCGSPTVRTCSKAWTRDQRWKKYCQRWCAGEAQMRDSLEGGELDSAVDDRRHCKNSLPFYPATIRGQNRLKVKMSYALFV